MKTIKKYLFRYTLLILSLFSLASCEEDLYYDYNDIVGEWRIVEAEGYELPYIRGDIWYLYRNGDFIVHRIDEINEIGYWERHRNHILISFESSNPEIDAYILDCDHDYMVLDVKDYSYNCRYTLRLIRRPYYD